jgi:hypothetical protein
MSLKAMERHYKLLFITLIQAGFTFLFHGVECFLKTIIFPVVLYGCETWSLKTAVRYSALGWIYLLTPGEECFLRTIIFPVVLYGCGTWSLTLREEQRLRVFENKVLRRIFGPKRDEVTGEW